VRHLSTELKCSSEERGKYRFGTTWGWENYERIMFCVCVCINYPRIIHGFIMV